MDVPKLQNFSYRNLYNLIDIEAIQDIVQIIPRFSSNNVINLYFDYTYCTYFVGNISDFVIRKLST